MNKTNYKELSFICPLQQITLVKILSFKKKFFPVKITHNPTQAKAHTFFNQNKVI